MTWALVVERLREALAGEFDIEGELGRGGMAAVFRARELALNRRVAIKVMAPGLLLGEGMVERFRQEAITIANLQHANIIGVHSVRTLGDLHLFVMQYVPGRSLDRVIHEWGRLSLASTGAVLYHVGSALDYAHRRGVVHRDVKPGNILLDADGDPIVTDFGIAKIAEAPGYTLVGTVLGTPTYMSPEQCVALEVGPPSDQYALGIVAYQCSPASRRLPATRWPSCVRTRASFRPRFAPHAPTSRSTSTAQSCACWPRSPRIGSLISRPLSEACAAQPLGSLGRCARRCPHWRRRPTPRADSQKSLGIGRTRRPALRSRHRLPVRPPAGRATSRCAVR